VDHPGDYANPNSNQLRDGVGRSFMGSLSIWHWVTVIVMLGSPVMGIMRGVGNQSVLNAVLSGMIPIYGIVYFFVGRQSKT
jgi:hypothetical protein